MPARKEKGFELLREQIIKSFELTGHSDIPTELNELITGLLKENNNYGLVWEEKTSREFFDKKIQDGYIPFIQEVAINKYSKPGNTIGNVIIEGDNYHSLKVLQATHKNKVDIIYIDPPYNTGNGDFKYNDKIIDKEDKYRHSKWLAFMQKRLELAHTLLNDTGLIFISIDENEYAQIKLLCDEIFVEKNYIENFIWAKNSTKNQSKLQSTNHEYILCYAKSKQKIQEIEGYFKIKKEGFDEVMSTYKDMKKEGKTNKEIEVDIRKIYKSKPEYKGIKQYKFVDDKGVFRISDTSAPGGGGKRYDVTHPNNKVCNLPAGGWRYAEETMKEHLANDLIYFGKNEKTIPQFKRYLDTVEIETLKSVIVDNNDGINDLQKFIPDCDFNNPKPVSLIKKLISTHPKNDALVLDFFGGSGTTGQAVLELNEISNGNRKFIICTNNEVSEEGNKQFLFTQLNKTFKVEPKLIWKKLKEKQLTILKEYSIAEKEPTKLSKDCIKAIFEKEGIQWNEELYQSKGICKDITLPRLKKSIDSSGGSLTYFIVDFYSANKLYKSANEILGDTNLQEQYVNHIDGLITLKESIQDYIETIQEKDFSIYKSSTKQVIIVKKQIYKDIDTIQEIKKNLNENLKTSLYFFFPDFEESDEDIKSDNNFKLFFSSSLKIPYENIISIPKEYIKKIIKGEFKI